MYVLMPLVKRSIGRVERHYIPLDHTVVRADGLVEVGGKVGPAACGVGREDIVAQRDQGELATLDARDQRGVIPLTGADRVGEGEGVGVADLLTGDEEEPDVVGVDRPR